MHAHVVDGVVRTVGSLPGSWELSDGRTVSGFPYLTAEEHAAEGWLPVVDDVPSFDPDTEQLGAEGFTVGVDSVTRTWSVVAKSPVPPTVDQKIAELVDAVSVLTDITFSIMEGL